MPRLALPVERSGPIMPRLALPVERSGPILPRLALRADPALCNVAGHGKAGRRCLVADRLKNPGLAPDCLNFVIQMIGP